MNYTSRILRNLFYHTKTDFSIVLNDIRNERDSIASYAHFHNASYVLPGTGMSPLTDFPFRLVTFLSLASCPLLTGFLPAVYCKPFCFLRRKICPRIVIAITFQKVDDTPCAEAGTQSNNQDFQGINRTCKKAI